LRRGSRGLTCKTKLRPRVSRERARRRIQQIIDHFMVGTPLGDFEYLDDEESQPDPATMI